MRWQPMKVLIVDGSGGDLLPVGGFLRRLGHAAVFAWRAEDALEKLRLEVPDLVLMDTVAAATEGRELVAKITLASGKRRVPIVLLTADGKGSAVSEAFPRHQGNTGERCWTFAHLAQDGAGPPAEKVLCDMAGLLCVCPEGVSHAQGGLGQDFGVDCLARILDEASHDRRFEEPVRALAEQLGATLAQNGTFLVAFTCLCGVDVALSLGSTVDGPGPSSPEEPGRWKVGVRLTAPELRSIEVVPMLLAWMDQLRLKPCHHGKLFLILGELCNNALDHGILHLDSSLKYQPDGFERYIELRRKRLDRLEDGTMEIEMERMRDGADEFLRICVKDSGRGFDYAKVLESDIASNTWPSGRGLALIVGLGARIEYTSQGREVTVLYPLS